MSTTTSRDSDLAPGRLDPRATRIVPVDLAVVTRNTSHFRCSGAELLDPWEE